MEQKFCKVCGKSLLRSNKTGFCKIHIPRSGANNPFYGKHHSDEYKKLASERSRASTKKLWESPEYREKVIGAATGKKRDDNFKEKQRRNAVDQMKNIEQRKLRSEIMKTSWQEDKITCSRNSFNRSKEEKDFIYKLNKKLNCSIKEKQVILCEDSQGNKKRILPDGLLWDNIVLEFNGDYWHANPLKYNPEDHIQIGRSTFSAKSIWNKDKLRYRRLLNLGYKIIVVWENAWRKDPVKVVDYLEGLLNWENLDFDIINICE